MSSHKQNESELSLDEVIKSLTQKFTSGNKIPVERATILREEWLVISKALNKVVELF